ncbi:conserved hypothetical protein [Thermosulfidibacter takaii ABI70S6]|uniref:Sulfotransferase n=1 Tax=Thermosulfidibacter takaii (strain DSM 17441 / JCM 13301 / NBRC 103674 / ABI70S6) TaxID=1298851 RepID=A0A0S3QRW3_THET7|nr:sulfotransferase [Thermosulfidibacter takaii]BAT71070.1 conserved hypothetical protein [Thermosulfidibacter takaii ABI70S6]
MNSGPIIVIGMHRSGTTMVSKTLEKLGIFMGWRKEENNEALFFLKLNNWILKQANATWDNPYNYTLADEDFRDLMTNLADKYIRSIKRLEYLGPLKFLKYKSLKELDFPWGWKDPRNTFTIDIWIKVFPNAKIIHIYRNPIDVANSLRNRALKIRKEFKWDLKKEIKLFLTRGFLGYGDSVRVLSLEEGIKLWREYVTHVFALEKSINLDIIHIKYEDFLENPKAFLKKLCQEMNMEVKEDKLNIIKKSINPTRKYAFINDGDLIRLYKSIKDDELIKKLGYSSLV